VHVTVYFVFSGISGTKKSDILSTSFCTGWATWLPQRGQVSWVVVRWVAFQPHPKMKNTRVRLPRLRARTRPVTTYAAVMSALDSGDEHRRFAVMLFNDVWRLMELEDRGPDEDALMIHEAHASLYHWLQAGTPQNAARGEWQCSRVYCLAGRAEPALYHAARVLAICARNGIADWDLAYAYEAHARAYAVAGDVATAREWLGRAEAALAEVAEEDDRELLRDDLSTVEELISLKCQTLGVE